MEFTSSVIFMEKVEKILLEEMVVREGQQGAADKIGCHQTTCWIDSSLTLPSLKSV